MWLTLTSLPAEKNRRDSIASIKGKKSKIKLLRGKINLKPIQDTKPLLEVCCAQTTNLINSKYSLYYLQYSFKQ